MTSDAVLDALATLLADRVAAEVADRLAVAVSPGPPKLATARCNPLGSRRAFLDAARRDAFPSQRRGREVVAAWADVEAYDRSRLRPRPPRPPAPDDVRRAALLRAPGRGR